MPKDWLISPPWKDREAFAAALGVPTAVAQVLHNRDVADLTAARSFLRPQMGDLLPPETLPGATAAAERIAAAIAAGRRIVIYGDYDVDGITGTAILWHCLRLCGANVDYYVPHRLEEGYGLNGDALETLAKEGAGLIVSVDCGITAIEPAARARERGVELIITDHHQPHIGPGGDVLLPDCPVVHPALRTSGSAPYANPHISGAGVAFKLAWAIAQRISAAERVRPEFREFLIDSLSLAALGTIADVVPLIGENRIIARHGLAGLPRSRNPGIQALIESAGLNGKKLDGYDIGFKVAPRLNAVGRMGHARLAVEMLTRADAAEAARIATHLEQQNRARQTLERRIASEARQMVVELGLDGDASRAIVLGSPQWHAGVIGIVAGRIADEFCRPTALVAIENGFGQGSARSIRNFALHEALAACSEHLTTFGGHAMAAGFKLPADRLNAFREAFTARAAQSLTAVDLRPRLRIDDVVPLGQLDESLVAALDQLEPFGSGNAAPQFATEELAVIGEPRVVGSSGDHLQVSLGDGRRQIRGIAFGQGKLRTRLQDDRRCHVAFRPMINEWNGRRSVELEIRDFQFPAST